MFATGHEPVLTTVTPAQNVIQSREIIRFRHNKQRLSCLTVSIVYRKKKYCNRIIFLKSNSVLLISMYLSIELCGPDINFYFQLLHKASF
jgi:hypothetical protein